LLDSVHICHKSAFRARQMKTLIICSAFNFHTRSYVGSATRASASRIIDKAEPMVKTYLSWWLFKSYDDDLRSSMTIQRLWISWRHKKKICKGLPSTSPAFFPMVTHQLGSSIPCDSSNTLLANMGLLSNRSLLIFSISVNCACTLLIRRTKYSYIF